MDKNIEVYIDDMVVKSKIVSEHIGDLTNIFEILRGHKLRLNASKCSFGVGSGKFLGYMVTHRGIEVNPNQIKAINNLQPLRNPKEVQKLTGMTAALNRFISQSIDKCRHFFLLINKWKGFEWTEECARAFQQLKEYLFHPPIMSSLKTDEVLFAYIVVAPHAMSLVLIRVDSGRQRPVYYVSKSLHEAEIRYLPLEKAILAMVHGTRKLPHYFQAYTVVILTQLPLKAILRSVDSQRNGQAETVNKVIVSGHKKRLDNAKGRWVEELPHVLWSYRTTPRRSTGETPFSMSYGAEAIIPIETGFSTLRTQSFNSSNNDEFLERILDLIEERRDNAMVQLAYYQHKLKQSYNAKVKLRPLELGDLVLRKVLGMAKNPTWGEIRT